MRNKNGRVYGVFSGVQAEKAANKVVLSIRCGQDNASLAASCPLCFVFSLGGGGLSEGLKTFWAVLCRNMYSRCDT